MPSGCANPRLPLARLTVDAVKRPARALGRVPTFTDRPTVHFAPLSRSLSLSPAPALGVEAIFPKASQPPFLCMKHCEPSCSCSSFDPGARSSLPQPLRPPLLLPSLSIRKHPRAQPHCGAPVRHPSDSPSAHALNHRRRLGRGEQRTSSFLLQTSSGLPVLLGLLLASHTPPSAPVRSRLEQTTTTQRHGLIRLAPSTNTAWLFQAIPASAHTLTTAGSPGRGQSVSNHGAIRHLRDPLA